MLTRYFSADWIDKALFLLVASLAAVAVISSLVALAFPHLGSS
jgi:hypothetical protein